MVRYDVIYQLNFRLHLHHVSAADGACRVPGLREDPAEWGGEVSMSARLEFTEIFV